MTEISFNLMNQNKIITISAILKIFYQKDKCLQFIYTHISHIETCK